MRGIKLITSAVPSLRLSVRIAAVSAVQCMLGRVACPAMSGGENERSSKRGSWLRCCCPRDVLDTMPAKSEAEIVNSELSFLQDKLERLEKKVVRPTTSLRLLMCVLHLLVCRAFASRWCLTGQLHVSSQAIEQDTSSRYLQMLKDNLSRHQLRKLGLDV